MHALSFPLQKPLKIPLQLSWRRGLDMPVGMEGYIQSVVVQGTVYVGGGNAGHNNFTVMEYDTNAGQWTKMPPYKTMWFAMTAIHNQPVLVGGHGYRNESKMVGVWSANDKKWTHPYPEMNTARSQCSVVVYNDWLVVAGGSSPGRLLSSVEVMNTVSKQWYAGPPMSAPWSSMKTAIVGDMCYFMGGYVNTPGSGILLYATSKVYSVSLPALVSKPHPQHSTDQEDLWKEIAELPTTLSTPLSISGSLLAVGGVTKDDNAASTTICLYQPDTGEWVKVGDLTTARYKCTCAVTADNKLLLVVGGKRSENKLDIAHLTL